MGDVIDAIRDFGIIPVVTIENAAAAAQLGEALITGGLPCAEITFRTAAAVNAIQILLKEFPQMLVGAGTVLTADQARVAVDLGAKFLVTPGFDEEIARWSLKENVPIFPGIATPTEINLALKCGLNTLKFFPAQALGGVSTLRAISAVYKDVSFIPTGGISPENLAEYLALPSVAACGGSWMVKKNLIADNNFEAITRLTAEAVKVANDIRSQ